jgi:hypothetical protein
LLFGKPGCHLCEEASAVVARVCADVGASWWERDISGEAELMETYGEQLPVTFVDGRQHDFWRVDETRLRAALDRGRPQLARGRATWWRRRG